MTNEGDQFAAFRRKMKRLRLEAGLKANAAARLTRGGISGQRWRNVERGYEVRGQVRIPANPSPDTVAAIARALNWEQDDALAVAGFGGVPVSDAAPDPWATVEAVWPKLTPPQRDAAALMLASIAHPRLPLPTTEILDVGTDDIEDPAEETAG
jgi:hypothetical protein